MNNHMDFLWVFTTIYNILEKRIDRYRARKEERKKESIGKILSVCRQNKTKTSSKAGEVTRQLSSSSQLVILCPAHNNTFYPVLFFNSYWWYCYCFDAEYSKFRWKNCCYTAGLYTQDIFKTGERDKLQKNIIIIILLFNK